MRLLVKVFYDPSVPFDSSSGTTIVSERLPWRAGSNDHAKVSRLQSKIDSRVFSVDALGDTLECVRRDDAGNASDCVFGGLSGL